MKFVSMLAIVLTLGFTVAANDAEAAKRLGGGKSLGMQRQATPPPAPAASVAKAPAAAAPGAAQAATPKRSWMGPLAGLAAGLGLAALASHFGFGEELASMLMMGLLAMAAVALIAFFMRRRAAAQQTPAGSQGGLSYATAQPAGAPTERAPYEMSLPGGASAAPAPAAAAIPADFDVAAFIRNAKVNFIRLQAANDAGNLDDLREFTTPEVFAEMRVAIAERGGATQTTDVVSINADVIEVAEEANRYVVSVRFSGMIREEQEGVAEAIDEIWHMTKPRDGKTGWVLAGIQQTQ